MDMELESPLRKDAINIHVSVPCPLKVRLKAELETFMADYNQHHAIHAHCPTLTECSPHEFEDVMAAASRADEVPDVWVTNNYHTLFTHPFKQRFIDSGIYVGVTKPEWQALLPPFFHDMAAKHNLGFLGFGSWGLVLDASVGPDPVLPKVWDDLVKPDYLGKLGLHGCSGHVSGTALLMVLRARLGEGAIQRFAGNVRYVKHFSQIIKGMDSSDAGRAQFNLMPSAAIRQIPSKKEVAQIALQDGPLLTPMLMFVKRDKLEQCQDILPFFWGEAFRDILAKGDIRMLDALDWNQPYSLADMDYLAAHDFNALSAELDAEFQAGFSAAETGAD